MKYSEKISKINYSTTIGTFKVVDISSYLVLDSDYVQLADTDVDNYTTLPELSGKIYSDIDSFWLFLYANNTINPFDLLKLPNSSVQDTLTNSSTTTITSGLNGVEVYFTPGSIIYNPSSNNGDTYSFGGTGNFSFTGGFALVVGYDTYTKKAIVQPYGMTFSDSQPVKKGIVKGGTYYIANNGDTMSSSGTTTQALDVFSVEYLDPLDSTSRIYAEIKGGVPRIKKNPPGELAPYEFLGTGNCYTYSYTSEVESRKINYFITNKINYSNFSQVTQKYDV
jgi:hypothetical protein